MKTTRNSPRARKERAVAKRFLRVDRLTERQMMRFHPSMIDQFERWCWLRRRLDALGDCGEAMTGNHTWRHKSTHQVRRWNGQGLPDVVPTVSATPFTARSLVGMTMGARKRLYQRIVDAFPTEGDAFLIDTEGKGVPIGWLLSRRLRPCPGCEECRGYDDGLGVIHCDGSGVLPARKAKR